jgi:hypothetical protein
MHRRLYFLRNGILDCLVQKGDCHSFRGSSETWCDSLCLREEQLLVILARSWTSVPLSFVLRTSWRNDVKNAGSGGTRWNEWTYKRALTSTAAVQRVQKCTMTTEMCVELGHRWAINPLSRTTWQELTKDVTKYDPSNKSRQLIIIIIITVWGIPKYLSILLLQSISSSSILWWTIMYSITEDDKYQTWNDIFLRYDGVTIDEH